MKDLILGLVGFGNIGTGVVKHLQEHGELINNRCGRRVVLKSICDKNFDYPRPVTTDEYNKVSDFHEITKDAEIDVVIELVGGTTIAYKVITEALKAGKHVVTANKAVIATFGGELFELARQNNVQLLFESAVGAGIPAIRALQGGLLPNKINGVYGILNGTCNFILTAMEDDPALSFDAVLKVAMEKGYAEPDPTLDIEGDDTAHKIAIMGSLVFGFDLRGNDTIKEGITKIKSSDFALAKSRNCTIKLVASAELSPTGNLGLSVWPTLVENGTALASIRGVINSFLISAEPAGLMQFSGAGAGQGSTGSGILSDICLIAQTNDSAVLAKLNPLSIPSNVRPRAGISSAHPKRIGRFIGKESVGFVQNAGYPIISNNGECVYVELPEHTLAERNILLEKAKASGIESTFELRIASF
ncbi:MAG: homoserine dehydrogenase [Sumerlaeia bacterium]